MTKRILAVEDSVTQAEALRAVLEAAGYGVSLATSGEAALTAFEAIEYDVVISDIVMPGPIDGYELCRRIKAGPRRETPVVLLTSLADPMDIIKGLESGADNFLNKPYDGEHLLQRLHVLLDTKTARRDSRMRLGIKVFFMGREFSISSEREQILDLLISTFEDAVRQNRELRQREAELEAARVELARYAGTLESDLKRFFDLSIDMIGVLGFDGSFKRVNPAWTRILGWTAEELLAQPYYDLVHPQDRDNTIEQSSVLHAGAQASALQNRIRCKDGSFRSLEWRSIPVPGERLVFAIARDVTDRERTARALEARAAQAAAVAALGQRAMVTDQLSELFIESVDVIEKMLHVPFSTVLERRSDGVSVVMRAGKGWAAEDIGRTFGDMTKDTQAGFTMATAQPALVSNFEVEGAFPGSKKLREKGAQSGVTVPIPGPVQPFGVLAAHDREPRTFTQDDVHFMQAIAHVLGTAVERHRTEAAMRQTQRMEAVGQLAGGVAHDFNNMLTAINGYGELVLAALPEGDPLREDMNEILKAAMRAAGLTRQLLAFSRQQVLQLRPVNLNEIVTNMEGMLRRLISENIDFTLALDPTLGRARADAGQIEQVILNLCVNARDAMPAGGRMTVETANVDLDASRSQDPASAASGRYVMLAVTDTGSGMDAETKAHVFEPFFTTKGQHGTGLGLATVYGVVKQSGGEIFVYSELGHGSTFKVFLPRLDDDQQDKGEKTPTKGKGEAASKGGEETVLLAEDEPAIRKLAERVLADAGYAVLLASNGEEALKVAGQHAGTIDLLVTDVVMPELGGRPLSLQLQSNRPALRTLYLSGYTDASVHQKGMLPEGEPFLQKPFTGAALLKSVRDVLDAA